MREKQERERDNRMLTHHSGGPTTKKPHHLLISENMKLGTDNMNYQLHSSTSLKFKLPRKIFSDSSTTVPRKLRSAIRKRSCESSSVILSDGNRSNNRVNGVDSRGRESYKKLKQNGWSDHSQRQTDSLAISKDEEEVAETLFALAGMIPLNAINENMKTGNESFEDKSAVLSLKQYSNPTPSSEDTVVSLKEEPETMHGSPNRLSERRQPNLDLEVSVPLAPFQIPPLLRACDSTEQNRENMSNERKPETYAVHKKDSYINLGLAGDLLQATEDRNKALTSKLLPDPGGDRLSTRPSAESFPSWLHNTSFSPGSFKDAPSPSKASCSISGGRKSWKRCIVHVCISHLIQRLQTSGGKDILPLGINQIRPLQCPASENKDNLTATLAAGQMFGTGVHKVENCHVQKEGSSIFGCSDLNKQCYNFLSLSTGVGAEVNNGVNRMGMTLDAKGKVLQLHSAGQHSAYLPCSMPQNRFPSISYRDQAAIISGVPSSMPPQVSLQLPPYFGNPCGPAHMGATTRPSQHPPSSQQQNWSAQLAAQFRPGPFLSSHIANWKNGTIEAHSLNPIQAPRPSQEMIGAKFLQISQQPQQQLFGLCQSMPSMSSAKPQHGQQPTMCEDKGGRFHPDSVLSLQLLCNERLLS